MAGDHLFHKGLVGCLHVKTKVNEFPLYFLPLAFLLLKDDLGVFKQLLQLHVCVVDAQLLKAVQLKVLEANDVNEAGTLYLGLSKKPFNPGEEPIEGELVGDLDNGLDGKLHLLIFLGSGHIVPSNIDPWFQECLVQVRHLDGQPWIKLLTNYVVGKGYMA